MSAETPNLCYYFGGDNMEATKQCTKCKTIKNISEFKINKNYKDGLVSWCTKCNREYGRRHYMLNKKKKENYYEKNKEDILNKCKIRYLINTESMAQKNKIYYANNKKKLDKYKKEYRLKNKDKINEQNKKSRVTNIEVIKAYEKQYRTNNKEKIAKYNKKYRADNKLKLSDQKKLYHKTDAFKISHRNTMNKRRFQKVNTTDGTIPINNIYPLTEELIALLKLQNNKCNNCKCDITINKHLDHHVPLSKGGTHTIDNVVWLCPSCNLSKNAKMPISLMLI